MTVVRNYSFFARTALNFFCIEEVYDMADAAVDTYTGAKKDAFQLLHSVSILTSVWICAGFITGYTVGVKSKN